MTHSFRNLALVSTSAFLASTAFAQTVHYSSGFEPPAFQLGVLAGSTYWNGQDGWLATGDGSSSPDLTRIVVQSAVVDSGAHAISIDATNQPTPYAHIRRNTQFAVPVNEPIVEISFDMRLSQPVSAPSEWGLQAQAGPGPGSGVLEWWIATDGRLHVTSATGDVPTNAILQRDRWYRLTTRVDTSAQTTSVAVDGQVAATVASLPGASWGYHAFTSLMFIQPGDDRMFVDDFSLTTHDGVLAATYCTAGTTTHGCTAQMSSAGTPSANSTSGFSILATNVEGGVNGTIFYGVTGRVAWPWATGSTSWLCVKSPQQRTGVSNSGGTLGSCTGALSLEFLAYASSNSGALGTPLSFGTVFDAQAWFRDAGSVKSSNTSNALEFTLLP